MNLDEGSAAGLPLPSSGQARRVRPVAADQCCLPLSPAALVEDAGWWAFWREGDVLGVCIVGELTDERNPVWRSSRTNVSPMPVNRPSIAAMPRIMGNNFKAGKGTKILEIKY